MAKRTVVHIEIPSSNKNSTQNFYSSLFGWKFQTDENFDYTMYDDGEGGGGGLIEVGEETRPGDVLVYFGTDDLDADMKKVAEIGGKVVLARQEIPGMGSYGVFLDPTGNKMALWESANQG